MLLFLNWIINASSREYFDEIIIPRILGDSDLPSQVIHPGECVPDLYACHYLIISGSELSAARPNPADEQLYNILEHFLTAEKPVLGICYGHQMLAKALAGEQACRRAARPEFGWRKLTLVDNPLFHGLQNHVFLVSHYDEVCNLPPDFRIIASSPDCTIHAFQYSNNPFWGVQFHPEYQLEDGNRLIARHFRDEPDSRAFAHNDLLPGTDTSGSLQIFRNFLRE